LNPLPVIVTAVLAGPDVGFIEIVGVNTVNVTAAEMSLLGVPVTWMLYVPGGTLPTVNVKLADPPDMPQFTGVTPVTRAVGDQVQLVSPVLNPLPVTCTSAPTGAEVTLSESDGVALTRTAFSAETNSAITTTRRVTANLAR
jgi:hypothetical protein